MKKLLCVISRAPYSSSHSLELIETAMVGAVFDFSVTILFRDEGVWNLLPEQDAKTLGQRTVSNVLQALPTYDIENIYVCAKSLVGRKLSADQLIEGVVELNLTAQTKLIHDQDVVMGAQS